MMVPARLAEKYQLILFNLLTHSSMSMGEALTNRDFVRTFVNEVFKADGADCPEKKINIIKAVRTLTQLGLKEAKDLVDGYQRSMVNLDRFREETFDLFHDGDLVDHTTMCNVMNRHTSHKVDLQDVKSRVIEEIIDIPF